MRTGKFLIATIVLTISLVWLCGVLAGSFLLAPYIDPEAQAAELSEEHSITSSPPKNQVNLDSLEIVTAYEETLNDIYERTLPSVVNIRVTQKMEAQVNHQNFNFPFAPYTFPGPYNGPLPQTPEEFYNRGQGSGFVWDKMGHIITNYHVVEDATDVEVIFADDKRVKAEVLGVDPDADLAVIKVDLPADALQPVTLGDSDDLQVGRLAIAIGNPFGQEFTMTAGIISAVGRTIRSGNSPFSIPEVIQTDAPINPGNSGGPLLNRAGEVVGINTQIISRSGTNAGIGFAVPINIAKQVVPTLINGETFEYAWLGLSGTTLSSEVADFMKLPPDTKGALIANVVQDGPADEAGLQGSDKTLTVAGEEFQLGGDVIVAINDNPVAGIEDLITYLIEETRPGDEVMLDVIRPDGSQEIIEVILGARPTLDELNKENR